MRPFMSFMFMQTSAVISNASMKARMLGPRRRKKTACDKIYDKITRKAGNLVKTGEEIEKQYGIPIINKRVSVTPVSLIGGRYTKDDYVATVDHYMDDPERFSRIFRTTSELLDKRIKVLHKRKADYEAALAAAEAIKALDYIIPEEEMIYLFKEVYVHYYDSLTVRLDSLKAIYQFVDVATSDTTYEGLRMIVDEGDGGGVVVQKDLIVDSLDVAVDTVALKDTVAKRDTVAVEDTLRHFAGQAEIKGVIKDILHK